MGFCRLTCSVCGGSRVEQINGGNGTVIEQTCSNCNGEGSIVTHTGVIGSHLIVEHPSPKADQADWATLWEKIDGIPELRESGPIEDQTSRSQ